MAILKPITADTERLAASMPTEGDTHLWMARMAARLAYVLPKERTTRVIMQCAAQVTHRRIPDREVFDAVAFGYGEVAVSNAKKYHWPEPQPTLIGEVLGECDPICDPSVSTGLKPTEVLPHLFESYSIICVSVDKFNAEAKMWPDDFDCLDAAGFQYIVANPLAEYIGVNQKGEPSVRCTNNIAERRHVVVEFDKEPDKTNQARLLSFLSETIPCVMVVDSGGKSLHGWFPVSKKREDEAATFFGQAVALGCDATIYDKAKLVRMPGGLRDGKTRQRIVYFDEDAKNDPT